MTKIYEIREWVPVGASEKELRTRFEHGVFATYEEASRIANAIGNEKCFPRQVEDRENSECRFQA